MTQYSKATPEAMTDIEEVQIKSLRSWWLKFKEKARKNGWKYSREAYKKSDNTLIVIFLDKSGNKHWLQISPRGDISFAPAIMTCF